METGLAIVEAHPEATLSTVIARQLLDLGGVQTEDRLKIQFFYENAIKSKGFIRQGDCTLSHFPNRTSCR
jgi:hypothetical protein